MGYPPDWWVRIPDDVSNILVGTHHGRCAREMTGDLRCSFLRTLTRGQLRVVGVNPCQGSAALDS